MVTQNMRSQDEKKGLFGGRKKIVTALELIKRLKQIKILTCAPFYESPSYISNLV